MNTAALLVIISFFLFLKLIIFIACSLKYSQNFFMQSLPLYALCLFSLLLNDDVVDIEKPEVILSDCNGTVLDMIKTYSQLRCTDKYLQHSSIIWPVWLNVWVLVYEIIGCGFKSCWSHLNFRYCACLEQGVSWHSGKHRVWIHLWMGAWHDKNIQSEGIYPSAFVVDEFWGLFLHPSVFSIKQSRSTWNDKWYFIRLLILIKFWCFIVFRRH